MSWTKRDYINQAYTHLGMADYVFDLEPDEYESALTMLDSMMAAWASDGISIGWPTSSEAIGIGLDDESGVTDFANAAIYLNLAKLLAPSHGKQVMPGTLMAAKDAYESLLIKCIELEYLALPTTTPLGAGTKSWRFNGTPFVRRTRDKNLPPKEDNVKFHG